MGLFKKITKPFKKAAEVITKPFAKVTNKLLPNELRFLAPYAAGIGTLMLPPGMGPLMRALSAAGLNTAGQIAADESATGEIDDLNLMSTGLAGGLGYLGAQDVTQGGKSGMGIRGGVERAGGMNPAEAAARFGEGTPQALEAAGSGGDLGFFQGAENVAREGVGALSDYIQGTRATLAGLGEDPASIFSSANKFKAARDVGKALGPTLTLGTGDVAYEAAIDAQDAYERADLEEQRLIDETTTADEEERATLQMKFMRQAGVPENDVQTTLIMNDLGDYYEPPVEAAAQGGIIGLKEGGLMKAKRGFVDGPGGYAGELAGSLNNKIEGFSQQMLDEYLQGNMPEFKGESVSEYYNRPDFIDADAIINIIEMGGDYNDVRETLKIDISDERLNDILGYNDKFYMKDGGITGLKDGGMLNFGGREMDLRTGGFVPIGKKERADDVPARLSKNEFVMTADAVRAAGGGSVNEGAKRMYEVMNKLEARA